MENTLTQQDSTDKIYIATSKNNKFCNLYIKEKLDTPYDLLIFSVSKSQDNQMDETEYFTGGDYDAT